ncbi:hypothetical protein Tsubulata_041164 [Turnera subulata]|uniref:Cupin type-1 domain-containing protein n=1 Tax=Turnera subulata TaxID=218843 RepID=A0A9Q0FW90_9ROSI|nr:hypothetical protein Tsubulata_041164 [Turnera subulata]
MANPRRGSSERERESTNNPRSWLKVQALHALSSAKQLLRKPHAFPVLLFFFLLLAWLSLQFHSNHRHNSITTNHIDDDDDDTLANLARFKSSSSSSPIIKDTRGWLLDPVSVARDSALLGGAVSCESVHVGEIRPGGLRGNHRHHFCNETFVIWGANTVFRLENSRVADKGYAQVVVSGDEVAVATSPRGIAHALINVDPIRTTFFIGCQDSMANSSSSSTDYNVWKDL